MWDPVSVGPGVVIVRGMVEDMSPDAVVERARELHGARFPALRELAEARRELERARAAMGAAEAGDTRAWAAAVKAGWSEQELRLVGLVAPGRRAPGRPRGPRPRVGEGPVEAG